jgi:hypothetical protein
LQNHMRFEDVLDCLDHIFRLALRELDDRTGLEDPAIGSQLWYFLQLLGILLRRGRCTGGSVGASARCLRARAGRLDGWSGKREFPSPLSNGSLRALIRTLSSRRRRLALS